MVGAPLYWAERFPLEMCSCLERVRVSVFLPSLWSLHTRFCVLNFSELDPWEKLRDPRWTLLLSKQFILSLQLNDSKLHFLENEENLTPFYPSMDLKGRYFISLSHCSINFFNKDLMLLDNEMTLRK